MRHNMSRILITIPTWNEAVVIERNLRALRDAVEKYLPSHEVTIEVADNGSTDGTTEIVIRVGAHGNAPVSFLSIPQRGKGLAIRRSWERHVNDEDVLVFMDADLAADVAALPDLVSQIVRGDADLVCGSRFVQGAKIERAFTREVASCIYRILQTVFLHLPVKDAQCGFKAISSKAAKQLLPLCQETGWMFDSELLAFAAQRGLRVREIPVAWIEHRDPARRSALRVMTQGWGFIVGLTRIRRNLR